MKLSRRIGLTYLIALIIAIFVCISYFVVFIKATKEGEKLRSAEISKGVRSRMQGKIDNINEKGKMIKRLIDNVPVENDESYELENFSVDEIFSNTKVDFSGIVDIDTGEVRSIFEDKTLKDKKYGYIISESIKHIKEGAPDIECGIISLNDTHYIINNLKLVNGNEAVILIRDIDEEFLNYIGESTGSKISIVEVLDSGIEDYKYKIDTVEYKFKDGDNEIISYSKIETLNEKDDIYMRVVQTKEVGEAMTTNFFNLSSIIFAIIIGTNVVIYIIINKRVIKRIVFVNDSVHKVDGKDYNTKKIETVDIKDEITDLSISINDMLDRVDYANSRVKVSERKYRGIINTMTNGFIYCRIIFHKNKIDGKIVDINDAAMEILNISEWKGKTLSDVFIGYENYKDTIFNTIKDLKEMSHIVIEKEVEVSRKRWGSITITMIEEGYFFIIINDITKIKLYSEEMKYLASYDHLTSLYNRRKLLSYVDELERTNKSYSFLYMDLDDFKKINDTLGHDVGDEVLKDVSKNLIKIACERVKIARLGGDEFVIIRVGEHDEKEIEAFGEKVINVISKLYQFNEFTYDLKVSIGVSRYPIDGQTSNIIIKYADIAMYNSKLKGGNTISIFNNEIKEIYELENKIKEGILKQEFIPYFQPIYNVKTNQIDGVEALIRWSTNGSIVTPDKFLTVAKRNGLMAELDKNMFISACEFSCRWKERYGDYPYISVNISNSLLIKKEFLQFILGTIQNYSIPAKYIKLEITEDELISDMQYVVSIIDYLRDLGVNIALDDFGTGYSSYNYINTLPVDVLKIDRSLVMNIEQDEKPYSIVQSLIELSKSLGIETICEGVENQEQLRILSELGCDKIQGYLFSKPLSENKLFDYVDAFERILGEGR